MQGKSKNDVLLTELVIVILVFSLVAMIVVQMFVAARQKSNHSGQLERALIAAQDWAERLSGSDDPAGLLEGAGFALADSAGGDTYVLAREASDRMNALTIEARVQPEIRTEAGRLVSATVSVFGAAGSEVGDEPLVALPVFRYIALEEVEP